MARAKSKLFGEKIFTLQDLQNYGNENSARPDDRNEPFVLHSSIMSVTPQKFAVVWTTERLLAMCRRQSFLQVRKIFYLNFLLEQKSDFCNKKPSPF